MQKTAFYDDNMTRTIRSLLALLLALLPATTLLSQPLLKFSVESFGLNQLDMTAQNDKYKKIDGSGSLYAIIKVTSATPDDDLREYLFDFGFLNHKVEEHERELWLYVQRNAKHVTIQRKGYETVSKYDLKTTIQAGRTYEMRLLASAPKVYTQMVLFSVTPRDSRAVVTVQGSADDATEEMLGTVDANGTIAKNLPWGSYTYKVIAEGYYPTDGRFTLADGSATHNEAINLRARFSQATLTVNADADIYVNNELKGRRTWTGRLNAGVYQVECRQPSHKPSSQTIKVEENSPLTVELPAPIPITGTLSMITEPLGAKIIIDGTDYGKTPCNIGELLVGSHTVVFACSGYDDSQHTVTVKDGEVTNLNVQMKKSVEVENKPVEESDGDLPVAVVEKKPKVRASGLDFALTSGGKTVTFRMVPVEPGSFMMGAEGNGASFDESPVHSVTLTNSFYLGETEVTQELWQAVMGKNPSKKTGEGMPVDRVSWEDCQKFADRLSDMLAPQLNGRRFRLPTEAEWEYAARGGARSKGYPYAGGNSLDDDLAWYEDNAEKTFHPVMEKEPNELGLFDMSGNVLEWCQDRYGSYAKTAQTDPTGASKGFDRVVRGGNYNQGARECRVSYRGHKSSTSKATGVGLRLAL